jgi:hypothetical protein
MKYKYQVGDKVTMFAFANICGVQFPYTNDFYKVPAVVVKRSNTQGINKYALTNPKNDSHIAWLWEEQLEFTNPT